jgi:hypothetical protein
VCPSIRDVKEKPWGGFCRISQAVLAGEILWARKLTGVALVMVVYGIHDPGVVRGCPGALRHVLDVNGINKIARSGWHGQIGRLVVLAC